ncbi:protein-disulfide reductase DsbD domain-containing protein [Sphingomonas sp.]|uniref:protein-disulfide reductase DsbD family protein n=1 Tax=Sphingomonas sp. TaxID=28214 RepID=UPI00181CE33B|nr:protein-disulfide reductase DsbD domain-containing protein [Sphingomonas sp.]MBA3510318.1 thioredoxin family protein [Sphingomonas sp.]
MLRRLFILLALLLTPALGEARTNAIQPELVAEGPAPPGGEVELAIHMRTKPGWHGYWRNPGDAGLPMEVEWRLPPGFAVGPLRYPVPTRLTIAGLMNYVYERDYAVLVRLQVPPGARGTVPIRAEARWLACTDKVCVPESGSFALTLPVGSGVPERARFDEWRRALSQPLLSPARFELSGQKLRVAIPLPSDVTLGEPYLFPITDGPVDYAGEQHFRRSGDTLIAELPRRRGEPGRFAGVLALGDGRGLEFEAVPGDVPDGGRPVGDLGARAILFAVLGAIAGGLLLNLMPCVFPILALKAIHLAKSGGEAAHARRDALAYAAGAVVGTGALGAALLAIRAAGSAVGWAFQLQDPRTIILLLLLSVAIALNLVGLFQVPALASRARPSGGFATGALAAFVATPCAGPFLGAALGTALLLPAAGSVLVFAALGLGLAIPFLAVGFVPALRKRLPTPGPWMVRLQRFLAIPMAATAAACLWLLYRQGGSDALLAGLATVVVLAVALAWIGSRQRTGRAVGLTAVPVLVALAAVAIWWVPERPAASARAPQGAEPWSQARVARHLEQGRPVFVYFTADWCLTCKANEVSAIDRSEVRKAFKNAGVRVLAGDWTNGDPAITRFLESRGRAGVPLYLWYRPGAEPEELPQILTASSLISRARQHRR